MGIIKNTILCLKYPFLYPRNRFTGKHYRNWTITNKINLLNNRNILTLAVNILRKEEYEERLKVLSSNYSSVEFSIGTCIDYYNNIININFKKDKFYINVKNKCYTYNIINYLSNNLTYKDVHRIYFQDKITTINKNGDVMHNPIILIILKENCNKIKLNYSFNFIKIILNKRKIFYTKFLNILESFLGMFHILPSYTELDAMEIGWKKAFGEQICKDIRSSLINTYIKNEHPKTIRKKIIAYYKGIKLLYNYRITQIKEKYGSLRWYDVGTTQDVLDIISKYENISYNTCYKCGNPTTYHTSGYILPVCDKCK